MSDVERSQHVGGEAESGGHLDEYLDTVEVAVQKVLRFAETTAQDLASTAEGDHDAEYYLRMIFARGAYLHPLPMDAAGPLGATPQADALAEDARLRREFTEEFTGLTGERKRILLDMLVTHSASTWEDLAIRSPPSGHAEELDNTLKLIKGLILFLKCRCGVDGFVCLVRNNEAYQMRPRWFFSSPNINQYMSNVIRKWDTGMIAYRLEAFALSGCNIGLSPHTASGVPMDYPRWLTYEIQHKIDTLLTQKTGFPDATMEYRNYERAILIRFGVALVGWTHELWASPSELPLDVEPLETLLEAVNTGRCYFRRLSAEEHVCCIDRYVERWEERRRRRRMARRSGN